MQLTLASFPRTLAAVPISWNEIRHNAIKFSRDWAGVKNESAEKQTFWNEFFQIFGLKRRVVASFEEAVKKISGDHGRIDLFWPGILLVEHKSFGEDLHKAFVQWDAIGETTRGEKTLYHAQIAPEARYMMTPEQWKRAAEILADLK